MISAHERGLDMATMRRMTVGQVVDYVVEYNNRQEKAEKEKDKPTKRWATQGDIDAFFGGY